MASTFTNMHGFYRPTAPTPLTVDTAQAQQKYFDEDDASLMGEGILDHSALDSGLEMSPAMADSRRESFAVGSSLFSPKQEDWQSVEMQSVPSNNPFLDQHQQHQHQSQQQQSNNPFMRLDNGGFAAPNQWPVNTSVPSSAGSMQQTFDGLPAELDPTGVPLFHRSSIPFSNATNHVTMFSSVNSQPSLPNSPQKDQWAGNMAMNKKVRPGSPGIRSHNELRKGDGIRKKNARFDIPAERNLENIDHLIQKSTDDQEIKELKQQKRLLRNRQAALDSRQRKKQHTERLEDEKKAYTAHIGMLEDENESLQKEIQELQMRLECMSFEKEQLIAAHTQETAMWNKRTKYLTDQLKNVDHADVSGASTMAGMPVVHTTQPFPGVPFAEMEGLNMGSSGWDSMGFVPNFQAMEPPQQQQPPMAAPEIKQEVQEPQKLMQLMHQHQHPLETQIALASKKADAAEMEKPTSQGGLLFMLFLVGALVCSSRSAVPSIPRVSEDVRVASATILENVMKDAAVDGPGHGFGGMTAASASGVHGPSASAPASSGGMAWSEAQRGSGSGLDSMADSLTQPTAEQTKEQLFSMSAAQYNSMTSQDFLHQQTERAAAGTLTASGRGRRTLAETLAPMGHGSTAEVYTRSLLWGQIPSDVVRKFVNMVADCSNTNRNAAGPDCDDDINV